MGQTNIRTVELSDLTEKEAAMICELVEMIVDDFRRARVPVQNDEMIRRLQLTSARVCVFDKIGYVVGDVTDHGARERNHADQNDDKTGDGNDNARFPDILDHKLHAAGIQNHGDGAERRFEQ